MTEGLPVIEGRACATTSKAMVATRVVQRCPYRERVRQEAGAELAHCGLLEEIVGAREFAPRPVRLEACEACCASFPPSPAEINPVIASLLLTTASEVIEQGGIEGCNTTKAERLVRWAEDNIRFVFTGDDGPPRPRRALGPCYHLGTQVGSRLQATRNGDVRVPVFDCRHPDHHETTPDQCHRCRDWTDRPRPVPRPIEMILPPPAKRRGPRVERWAVGVTTAPRREPTLDWCLDSLHRAGWTRPHLFIDSKVALAHRFTDLPTSVREPKLGAWPNYFLAVSELLMREPEADAYLIVQDDAVFDDRHNLREHLEQILWPADPIAAVSLYSSQADSRPEAGWHYREGPWIWGAVAFVFPRESARRFVTDPVVLSHRWLGRNGGTANIDTVIGAWAAQHGLPIVYPSPSLVQHIGDASTLWPNSRAVGTRRADRFAGDLD